MSVVIQPNAKNTARLWTYGNKQTSSTEIPTSTSQFEIRLAIGPSTQNFRPSTLDLMQSAFHDNPYYGLATNEESSQDSQIRLISHLNCVHR